MKRVRITVTPHKVKGQRLKWRVRVPGTEGLIWQTKRDAVFFGREKGRSYWRAGVPAQLVVHLASGVIEFESTYGRDPRRYKG